MPFVYTGKGRRQAQNDNAPPEQRLCAKQACAIQWCLAKRDHKEHLCQAVIDDWKACCDKVKAATAAAVAKENENDGVNVNVKGKEGVKVKNNGKGNKE